MAQGVSKINEFTFTWEINNINYSLDSQILKSPLFKVKTKNVTSWYLSIYNMGDSLNLVKKGAENYGGIIGYEIKIHDEKGRLLYFSPLCICLFKVDKGKNEEYNEKLDVSLNFYSLNVNKITICCIMNFPEPITDLISCKARTKIEIEQCSFTWNVKNFLTVDQISKVFCCSQSAQLKMTLTKCESFVSIVIEGMEDIKNVFIACKIALLDINGSVTDSRSSGYFFGKSLCNNWEFPNFLKIRDLFLMNGKYLEYNTFSLLCEFSISEGSTLEEVENCEADKSALNNSVIESQYHNFLFRVFKDGNLNNWDYESVCKFLVAASKFEAPSIKEDCANFLLANLNNENVCDVLSLADKVSNQKLKDSAIRFIVEHADAVLTAEIWSHFVQHNNKLVTDIIWKLLELYFSLKNVIRK